MISWLLVIILAYLCFSVSSLGDKLVLNGKPKPVSYTFYACFLSIFLLLFLPFINFKFPDTASWFWIILESITFIAGVYIMFAAVEKYDISRVAAITGATQPIFIFILSWMFWGLQSMTVSNIIAFIILIIGSAIISFEKDGKTAFECLKITLVASLIFALDYVFSKFVYLNQPFLQGFILMKISSAIFVLLFLISKTSRKEIFAKNVVSSKKIQFLFAGTQLFGGTANILQGFAISLAPISLLAVMNSLKGIQYAFLFILTLLLSHFFPKALEQKISKEIIIQKTVSIILIGIGLAVLVI